MGDSVIGLTEQEIYKMCQQYLLVSERKEILKNTHRINKQVRIWQGHKSN